VLLISFPHLSTPVVQTTLAMPVATGKERLSHTLHYPTAVLVFRSRNIHSIVKVEILTAQKETYYCEVCYRLTFDYFTFSDDIF
jgi:hypothetical protein